ncbi:hypothetical protein D3C80_1106980 [compost metagenome]
MRMVCQLDLLICKNLEIHIILLGEINMTGRLHYLLMEKLDRIKLMEKIMWRISTELDILSVIL